MKAKNLNLKKHFSKMWRLLSSALLVAFISISCQKDSPESGESKSDNKNSSQPNLELSVQKNGNKNPFNYVGQVHTYALDHLANQSHFPNSNKAQIYNTTKSYLKSALNNNHFYNHSKSQNNYNNQIKNAASSKIGYANLNHSYFFNYFTSSTNLSPKANNYLNNLKTAYNQFKNYDNLQANLKSIKGNITGDRKLSNKNRKLLLGMVAIAQQDASYWYKALGNKNHSWHNEYTKKLNESQQIDLMVNLSASSAMVYGITYLNEISNKVSHANSVSAAILQASYSVGPVVIEDGDMD